MGDSFSDDNERKIGMRILGGQFGVEICGNIGGGNGVYIQLLSEDDGNWFEVGESFSSLWLNDLIKVCKLAKQKTTSRKGKSDA